MSEMDEGLRSELQRQGIWVTSTQELYNWGRRNSIWPLQFGQGLIVSPIEDVPVDTVGLLVCLGLLIQIGVTLL